MESDADMSDMEPSLLDRAQAWQKGDWDSLDQIMDDISEAFDFLLGRNDEEEEGAFQAVCDKLIIREDLPAMQHAQLYLYRASTHKEGAYDKIRKDLERASYWVSNLKILTIRTTGSDPRVERLARGVRNGFSILNAADPPSGPEPNSPPASEEEVEVDEAAGPHALEMEDVVRVKEPETKSPVVVVEETTDENV
ncbi:hypothetical protein PRZ48_003725 [Zasmidium cellare]|uniref:Uncharacterized protein n=1 Tax=Zasmidium cellare TaxID=395010 RepID=A0ABR0EWF5_ZASCE|nr:hypothetical protein PRZ48_003725 [Zasmidium cellare]